VLTASPGPLPLSPASAGRGAAIRETRETTVFTLGEWQRKRLLVRERL
jgi:hypothetical protein